eukprot:3527458-Alexandrium_andersonii.AAC.1
MRTGRYAMMDGTMPQMPSRGRWRGGRGRRVFARQACRKPQVRSRAPAPSSRAVLFGPLLA